MRFGLNDILSASIERIVLRISKYTRVSLISRLIFYCSRVRKLLSPVVGNLEIKIFRKLPDFTSKKEQVGISKIVP